MSVNEKNESQVKTSDKKESFKKDEHYVIKLKSIDGELVERRCCKICDHDYSQQCFLPNLKAK